MTQVPLIVYDYVDGPNHTHEDGDPTPCPRCKPPVTVKGNEEEEAAFARGFAIGREKVGGEGGAAGLDALLCAAGSRLRSTPPETLDARASRNSRNGD